jgi:hypothetical protein
MRKGGPTMKHTIIRVGNNRTSFDVIGATVQIGADKNGHYMIINGKKIYGLHYVKVIGEVEL